MKQPIDLKALGELIGGLLAQQKKEIVEELDQKIQASNQQLRTELRKEIRASQEQLRKEIRASQEQTVKDLKSYFEESIFPLLGEYDARLQHQEAHTTHPPGAPAGL